MARPLTRNAPPENVESKGPGWNFFQCLVRQSRLNVTRIPISTSKTFEAMPFCLLLVQSKVTLAADIADAPKAVTCVLQLVIERVPSEA